MTIKENKLHPILVGDLLKQEDGKPVYNFYIPSYQRGYRWDKDQITDLLEDLYDFIYITKGEKYCLQPIVVKKMQDERYEVLDGQQRLTTIFILLNCIKRYNTLLKTYSLSYQTRTDSETFLQQISTEINDSNPDYYYISQAYMIIDTWLTKQIDNKSSLPSDLQTAFGNRIEFIWYEILENTNAVDVFTRINVGKIALTNSELVKAVFLSKDNMKIGFQEREPEVLNLLQNRIAFEWDQLEKKLRNDKFWYFVLQSNKSYETRIDYILELLSPEGMSSNTYASFRYFYDKIKKAKQDKELIKDLTDKNYSLIEYEWDKIKSRIEIFDEWFNNHYYYHFIGFLITLNFPVSNLVDAFLLKSTKEFNIFLKESVYSYFKKVKVEELYYRDHHKLISQLLLLVNIDSTYSIPDNSSRFPFDSFKSKKWSLEHIYAQNSEDFKEKDYIVWLRDNKVSIEKKTANKEAADLLKEVNHQIAFYDENGGKFDNIDFVAIVSSSEKIYTDGLSFIDTQTMNLLEETEEAIVIEDSEEEKDFSFLLERDSIMNLALLDKDSNSHLSYSLFDVKRSKILDRDKEGSYIPIETKRVFLKYHTPKPENFFYWTVVDKLSYLEKINTTLDKFK
ncbi:DUF262 domain-containing protein [Chryseobacterium shigense]|uniref:GmrSD restriction endonucleases N-terminal domain-containing protein n=1 Tax=Chryseobacterium shigense TaxID=297244 RepID=A0A841N159_9FLAO|nr:DUF262 domain-containing protein [Chryseobacterium shigense]MBB6370574.1 hypothetical protein [Chryseobacterium shigense]